MTQDKTNDDRYRLSAGRAFALFIIIASGAWFIPRFVLATNYMSFGAECAPPGTPCMATSGYWTITAPIIFRGPSSKESLSTTVKHSGSKSLQINIDALGTNESVGFYPWDDAWSNYLYFPGTYLGLDLYYRWWMRIEPGFNWGDGQRKVKITRLTSKINPNSSYLTGYISNNEIYIAECLNTGYAGNCKNNQNQPAEDMGYQHIGVPFAFDQMADGVWHEYIWRMRINSSATCTAQPTGGCDSIMQLWVDGVQQPGSPYNGWKMTTDLWGPTDSVFEHFGAAMLNPYFQLDSSYSAGGSIYLDDWSVDSVYNSLLGGGDSTPPAAPTGLVAQ